MKPLKITLEGFLSFRLETTIDLENLEFVAVTGHNGAGKSSIINAIAWVLYGEDRLHNNKDSVINDLEDSAIVTLDFQSSAGDLYRVRRVRHWEASTELIISRWDDDEGQFETLGDHTIRSSQEKIDEILRMNKDSFYSLMVTKQSSMSGGTAFTGADPDSRRAILMSLVPELDVWSHIEYEAQENAREARSDVNDFGVTIETHEKQIDDRKDELSSLKSRLKRMPQPEALEKRISELDDEIETLEDELAASSEDRQESVDRLKAIRAKRQAREADRKRQLSEAQSTLKEIRSHQSRIEEYESDEEDLKDDQKNLNTKIDSLNDELADLKKSLKKHQSLANEHKESVGELTEKLAGIRQQRDDAESRNEALELQSEHDHDGEQGKCLVCDSPLSSKKLKEIQKKVNAEYDEYVRDYKDVLDELGAAKKAKERADSRLRTTESDISGIEYKIETTQNRLKKIPDEIEEVLESIKKRKAQIKEVGSVASIQKKIDSLSEETEVSKEEQKLQDELQEAADTHELGPQIRDAKEEKAKALLDIDAYNRAQGSIDSLKSTIKKSESTLKAAEKDLRKAERRLEDFDWVKKACSQRGIPNMLISSILTDIEDRQNELLERLLGDKAMRVEFSQEKQLKSRDGTKPTLDINVRTENDWVRPIESFSGGEQVRLTLSNLFAMLQVFNQRTGGMVSTLFLDEPFGHLDEGTIPIVIQIIQDALQQKIVESVFVVSHDPRVLEQLPQRLEVAYDKANKTSTFEIL